MDVVKYLILRGTDINARNNVCATCDNNMQFKACMIKVFYVDILIISYEYHKEGLYMDIICNSDEFLYLVMDVGRIYSVLCSL